MHVGIQRVNDQDLKECMNFEHGIIRIKHRTGEKREKQQIIRTDYNKIYLTEYSLSFLIQQNLLSMVKLVRKLEEPKRGRKKSQYQNLAKKKLTKKKLT